MRKQPGVPQNAASHQGAHAVPEVGPERFAGLGGPRTARGDPRPNRLGVPQNAASRRGADAVPEVGSERCAGLGGGQWG